MMYGYSYASLVGEYIMSSMFAIQMLCKDLHLLALAFMICIPMEE